jgi:uracil-DNA glycosylase
MDFYYPGKAASGDLPPRRDFAATWHPAIFEQLTDVRVTLLVGGYAQRYYLGARAKPTLTETVRGFDEYLPALFPLVHPSPLNVGWHLKNPWFESEVVPELRRVVSSALA